MKTIITTLALGATLLHGTSALADSGVVEQEALAHICAALQQDDVSKLRREVKDLYGRMLPVNQAYRIVAEDLRCNGFDAISFAVRNDAMEAASLLAGKAGMTLEQAREQAQAIRDEVSGRRS